MSKKIIKNLVAYAKAMDMLSSTPIRVTPKFILSTLRNSGYNAYSAILDVIDNSLEANVASKNVSVDFEYEYDKNKKPTITAIIIIDDGSGMDYETLKEALALGSETGKDASTLGMYGSGMKASTLSIGRILEVFTKMENDKLLVGRINLDDAFKEDGSCNLEDMTKIYASNDECFEWFKERTKSSHGTIVRISNLDRMKNLNLYNFSDTLREKVGQTYNRFILNDVVNITVYGKPAPKVDLMTSPYGCTVMGEGSFKVDGHEIRYKACYLHVSEVSKSDADNLIEVNGGVKGIARNQLNQGFYLYRNDRLVGKGLSLGMFTDHSTKNGFRCELSFDGDCDYLFGSTFTKIVSEKSKSSQTSLNQSLVDSIKSNISVYWNEAYKRYELTEKKNEDDADDEKNKTVFRNVTDMQNKNKLLNINRKPEKQKNPTGKNRGKYNKSGKYVGTTHQRWLGGMRVERLGKGGDIYVIEHENGFPVVVINKDHALYDKLFSKLPSDLKTVCALALSCTEIARDSCGYYYDDDIKDAIDQYESSLFCEITKSLNKIGEPENMDESVA